MTAKRRGAAVGGELGVVLLGAVLLGAGEVGVWVVPGLLGVVPLAVGVLAVGEAASVADDRGGSAGAEQAASSSGRMSAERVSRQRRRTPRAYVG